MKEKKGARSTNRVEPTFCNALGIRDGFTFSAGFTDWGLNFLGHNHEKPFLILVIGAVYAVVYYFVFRFMIVKFDLKTPGREAESIVDEEDLRLKDEGAKAPA